MAETVMWIDPDGAITNLHQTTTHHVSWNLSGRFSPPARFEEEGVPEFDGMRLRAVHHDAREFVLPVWLQATTEADLRVKVRALVTAMNPKRGDGKIRVTSPIGDQREIGCRVVAGLDAPEKLGDTSTLLAQMMVLVFRAWDPYWQDTADTVSGPWTVGANPGTFFPFFPLRLSSSEVFAQVTVTNSGDVDAWPVWTITGPGANPRLKNLTTGKTFDLPLYVISAGETVTIDTRPGVKTVVSSFIGNLYGKLSGATALWPLIPGSNAVSIEMSAATSASSVQMARRHRYLSV